MAAYIGVERGIIVEMVLVRYEHGSDRYARSTRRGISDIVGTRGMELEYVGHGAETLRLGAKYNA